MRGIRSGKGKRFDCRTKNDAHYDSQTKSRNNAGRGTLTGMVKKRGGKVADANALFFLRKIAGIRLSLGNESGVSRFGLRRTVPSEIMRLAAMIDDGLLVHFAILGWAIFQFWHSAHLSW